MCVFVCIRVGWVWVDGLDDSWGLGGVTGPTQAPTCRGSAKSRILGVLRASACLHSGQRGIRVCTIPACFLLLSPSYAAVYLQVCRLSQRTQLTSSTPSSAPLRPHPGGHDADFSSACCVLAGDKCGINTCWLEAAVVQGRGQGVDRLEARWFQRADGPTGSRQCSARDVLSGPDTTSSRQDSAVSCCLPCTLTHLDWLNTHMHAHTYLMTHSLQGQGWVQHYIEITLKGHLQF